MKSTRDWQSKSFIICFLILLISCSPQIPFSEYSASSAPEAIDELMRRRSEFRNFEGEGVFELVTPSRKFKMNGSVYYDGADEWDLRFTGPLGIEMGEISTNGKEYTINSKLIGGIKTGSMEMPIEVPKFDLVFPELQTLTRALVPMLDIQKSDNWELQGSNSGLDEELSLKKMIKEENHEMKLNIEYSPLRVIREVRLIDGVVIYQRDYSYKSKKSTKVTEISVVAGMLKLNIRYNSLTYNYLSALENDIEAFQ